MSGNYTGLSKNGILPPTRMYWQNQWKQQRLARLAVPRFDPPQSFWNDKKRLEDHFIQNLDGWRKDAEERIAVMGIRDGSRVLDIGAGQGPFAFRSPPMAAMSWLSNRAEAMRNALILYQQQQQTREITLVPKCWEDVSQAEPGAPFDVVIASYSLMITDIGAAIQKMNAICTGTVHLFWFLTQPLTARLNMDLWPQLHGAEFPGEPTAECLWQVLVMIWESMPISLWSRVVNPPTSPRWTMRFGGFTSA